MRRPFGFLVLFLALAAHADSGTWGARGVSRRFLVQGNLVFDADGRGMAVYDVSAPPNIRRTAVAETDDESLDAAFIGPNELAVLTRGAINRYTFTNAGALSLASSIPLTGGFTQLASGAGFLAAGGNGQVTVWQPGADGLITAARIPISGTLEAMAFHRMHLLVAIENTGIFSYGLDDGSLTVIPVPAHDLAVSGDALYAAAGANGLVLVDLTNDNAPNVVSRSGAGETNLQRVAVAGARAYATEHNDTVRIYDVASPASPAQVGTIHDYARTIAATGTRLFLSGSIVDAFGLTNETGLPLRVYDTSNAQSARAVGDYHDLTGPVSGVATDGTFAYVVDPPFLRVIDVSSPSTPREVANVKVDNLQDQIKLQGKRAIVYGRGDVDLFDLSDPYHPKFLGVFVSFGRPPSRAAFAGAGNTIIEGNPWSGFHVVDFDYYPGDATRPVQIAGIKGHYKEIVGTSDHAFAFDDAAGLRVVDLTKRGEAPTARELVATALYAEIVAPTASHPELLLASATDGLRIFNTADWTDPQLQTFLPLAHAIPFASAGDTTFLAVDGSVLALDLVSGTTSPTGLRVVAPMQVAAAANGKVVVADRYALRVFGPKTDAPAPPAEEKPGKRRAAKH